MGDYSICDSLYGAVLVFNVNRDGLWLAKNSDGDLECWPRGCKTFFHAQLTRT